MHIKFSLIVLMTIPLLACSTAKQDKGTIVINNNSSALISDVSVEYTSAKKSVPIGELAPHASTTYKIDYSDAEDTIVIHYTDAQHNKYTQTAVPYAAKYDQQHYVVDINPDLISDKSKVSTPQTALTNNPNSEAKGPAVYVTAIDDLSGMSDGAAIIGVLNVKNGCLMLDDDLLIITSALVHWIQHPFVLTNHAGEEFKLGDKVQLGGSSTQTKNLSKGNKTKWQNPPLPECLTDKALLVGTVNKPHRFD